MVHGTFEMISFQSSAKQTMACQLSLPPSPRAASVDNQTKAKGGVARSSVGGVNRLCQLTNLSG
jgi:hypothetical protein